MRDSAKIPVASGIALAGIGALVIVLTDNYPLGSKIFACGFLVTVVYFVGATLFASGKNVPRNKALVSKLVAFGFGLLTIPSTIGVFLLGVDDSDVMVFVNYGITIVIVGLVINLFMVLRGRQNDA
jgi:hypothetical protein